MLEPGWGHCLLEPIGSLLNLGSRWNTPFKHGERAPTQGCHRAVALWALSSILLLGLLGLGTYQPQNYPTEKQECFYFCLPVPFSCWANGCFRSLPTLTAPACSKTKSGVTQQAPSKTECWQNPVPSLIYLSASLPLYCRSVFLLVIFVFGFENS